MNLDSLLETCSSHGETDADYLRFHYRRFITTYRLFVSNYERPASTPTVLDLGAHWLHQAVIFANGGFRVTAVDLPLTFERESVIKLAAAHDIALIPCENLADPGPAGVGALTSIPDDSIDVLLMTEILEHLAFNPLAMWRQLYRVMKPGARIVISTPNYYALRSLIPKAIRFGLLRGGSLATQSVLTQETFAHHWKEYSAREIKDYFAMLSPDFALCRALHVRDYYPDSGRMTWLARGIEAAIPLLRPNLHAEIDLGAKNAGITLNAGWST